MGWRITFNFCISPILLIFDKLSLKRYLQHCETLYGGAEYIVDKYDIRKKLLQENTFGVNFSFQFNNIYSCKT